jgi:rhamnogalacturonan endolyase
MKSLKPKLFECVMLAVMFIVFSALDNQIKAQRQMESLTRGVVAIKSEEGIFVSWRMFGTDPDSIAFNVYRDGIKLNSTPITNSTNYFDASGDVNSYYTIYPIVDGVEQEPSNAVIPWGKPYITIPLQTPNGYQPGDCSAGDLDGDGEYEIVVIMEKDSKDNSQSGTTGQPKLEAYKLNGAFMWRIDLGKNIRCGAHYTQFMVYDLDGNGKAEVVCKTADGTKDGIGVIIGSPTADYRNSNGYILSGPEFLTLFDGETGKAVSTVDYITPRGVVGMWGDTYGNRVDRFLACIAYLDGIHPSVVMCRGYYSGNWNGAERGKTSIVAWDFKDGSLTQRWNFNADLTTKENINYIGQGNHNLSVGDVDDDGKDEIVYGACAIDDDGKGLYSTRLGHGDAMHLTDHDPDRPGLEVFQCHENNPSVAGAEFRDAKTGELIWGLPSTGDVGRALAIDIDANYPGNECWVAGGGIGGLYSAKGEKISNNAPSSTNFAIWWDGDLLRELLNSNRIDKYGGGLLLQAEGCTSNNGTKSTPALSADLFGDWREEVVFRTTDNKSLRIYSTTIPTENRIYTLMHDPQYRLSIAWQNVAYNQPPHTGFFLGSGMKGLPVPNIKLVQNIGAPSSSIISPSNGTEVGLGLDVVVVVNASDFGGSISKVELFNGDSLLGILSASPYIFTLKNLITGTYPLTARVTDNEENQTISSVVTFTVDNGFPHVAIISPASGILINQNSNIEIIAEAYDTNGSISKVEFYANNTKLGDDSNSPFTDTFSKPENGVYNLTAVATDNDGNFTTSAIITVEVGNSVIIQEGETGACNVDGIALETTNAGFTGAGYCNTDNAIGKGANWKISLPEKADYILSWRYAATSARPGNLLVNGVVKGAINLLNTGAFDTWLEAETTLGLQQGVTSIRLEASTEGGLPNIDYLKVTAIETNSEVLAIDCSTPVVGFFQYRKSVNELGVYQDDQSGLLIVDLGSDPSALEEISLFFLTGQQVLKQKVDLQSEASIDVSTLKNHIYMVQVKTGNQMLFKKCYINN